MNDDLPLSFFAPVVEGVLAEGDKIVEHWDVLQVITNTSANDNGLF